MLSRFSVKGRMYLIVFSILIMFMVMAYFAIVTANRAKDLGIEKTGEVMLLDQKDKIKVASHSIAVALGHAIENVPDAEEKISIIRKLIDDIRFEADESGYYFVYEDTTVVALPPNKKLEGQNLVDAKDKNGNYFIRELRKVALAGGGFFQWTFPKPGAGETPKLGYAEMIPGTTMWIGTGVYLDNIDTFTAQMAKDISAEANKLTTTMLVISGIIFAAIITLCLIIAFGIVNSLKAMIVSFRDIAQGEGDLTKRIAITGKDEMNELAGWFNTFLEHLQKIILLISRNTAAVGEQSHTLSSIAASLSSNARETRTNQTV